MHIKCAERLGRRRDCGRVGRPPRRGRGTCRPRNTTELISQRATWKAGGMNSSRPSVKPAKTWAPGAPIDPGRILGADRYGISHGIKHVAYFVG